MGKRTPLDFNALGLDPKIEGPLPPTDLPSEKPTFSDFSIESEPHELSDDDPNRLTLFTKFGRKGGAKMGGFEDLTANAIFDNPRVLGVDPGQWVDKKDGCPFSSTGHHSKGHGISIKCDGEWLNFICRDPEHKHPDHCLRTGKDGRDYWIWSLKNPASTGYAGRKFLPFKRGDHVELAEAILSRLGDCAWDSGDRIRVFDARFVPKGKSVGGSPTAGLWVHVPEDDVKKAIRELSGEWVLTGKKYAPVKMSNSCVNGVYEQLLSILRQGLKAGPLGLISKFAEPPPRIVFKGSAWDLTEDKVVYAEKMRNMYCTPEEQLDVRYGGEGGTPEQFLKFLSEVWEGQPDLPQRILFVQEWIGLALAGKVVEVETHLVLQGTTGGSNGKSRFLNILAGLFPACQVSALSFSDLSHNFKLAMLMGSRLNIYGDVRAEVVNSSLVKQVTSGDVISMDRKNKDPIVARAKAAWAVGVNDTFIPSEGDKATFRRWKVLTFERTFSGGGKTSLAEDILAAEKALIIEWALEGLRRWSKNKKFTEFSTHEGAMKAWHHRADSVEQWLQDCVTAAPDETEANAWPGRLEHYAAYADWAKRCGFRPAALNRFGSALEAAGLTGRVRRGGKQVPVHKVRFLEGEISARPSLNINLDN